MECWGVLDTQVACEGEVREDLDPYKLELFDEEELIVTCDAHYKVLLDEV